MGSVLIAWLGYPWNNPAGATWAAPRPGPVRWRRFSTRCDLGMVVEERPRPGGCQGGLGGGPKSIRASPELRADSGCCEVSPQAATLIPPSTTEQSSTGADLVPLYPSRHGDVRDVPKLDRVVRIVIGCD